MKSAHLVVSSLVWMMTTEALPMPSPVRLGSQGEENGIADPENNQLTGRH